MPGDKKGSDLASRLKRPGKISSRSSKTSPAASPISAPPKAALATGKAKKDDLHRRKHGLAEMLLQASSRDSSRPTSSHSPPDDDDRSLATVANDPFASSSDGRAHLDRIAELEKALAISHSEQQSMAEEIKKLQQHELAYRDAIDTYKEKLSDSNDHRYRSDSNGALKEFEQETDRHRFWNKERSELQEEVYDLKDKLEELQAEILDRETIWSAQWEHERANWIKERNKQAEALHNADKEVHERRKQLLELKQTISALTRIDDQATDSDLADRMDQLYHRIREWVISNFRRSKLDVSNPKQETIAVLEAISPQFRSFEPTDKISLYQAVVAYKTMKIFEENMCVGLPISGVLSETRALAKSFQAQGYQQDSQPMSKPDSEGPDFRDWRRSTIRMIQGSPLKDTLKEGKFVLIHSLVESTLNILEEISGVTKSDAIQSSLYNIFDSVANLQSTLLSQKARYSILFVLHDGMENAPKFDAQKMEPVNEFGEVG
ncbi:uncharacterized protein BDZ99DRAFT_575717 [Mytilinidion resinicola]|uniref:Uncharacterized protein n=1 Tax=Mytilinidion resinicola TaxID=574789 RepID=A0A6A6Y5J3_9PEZI|nr:uncharacterized protein BDZ99DRAFT_575717 [Mytilinidion resinicola]KAF2804062.1 hypothetical protein BDZ99DRAFT_575717 [Mytilinidion resinicola]